MNHLITGNRPDIPVVSVDRTEDLVRLDLNGHDAEVLAKILAHYDALITGLESIEPAENYDHAVWHHTLLELLVANAQIDGVQLAIVGDPR